MKYFIYLPSLVCKQPNVQIMCGVKLNLKKYYLHDRLPNESIMLMLSTPKIMTMTIVKSIIIFYDFFHDESVSFVVGNYL